MSLLKKIVGSAKRSAKKAGLVGALVASSLLGSGCGSGKHKNSEDYPAPQEEYLTQPEIDLTSHLIETQFADGGWSPQPLIWYEPIDYSAQGSVLLTGVTGLGLFDAHKVDLYDGKDSNTTLVPETLQRAKEFIYEEALPNNGKQFLALSDFLFMKKYDERFGLSQEERDSVEATWGKLLQKWDLTDGTDPLVQIDGMYNKLYKSFASVGKEALVGNFSSQLLRSAIAMNESPEEIDWIQDKLRNSPIDPEIEGGLSSIARTLHALNEAGDVSMNVPLLEALNSKRNFDGSYGLNPESSVQTTAYALMALKEIGSPDAVDTHNWLEAQIRNGQVYDPVTGLEKADTNGQALEALLMDRKP